MASTSRSSSRSARSWAEVACTATGTAEAGTVPSGRAARAMTSRSTPVRRATRSTYPARTVASGWRPISLAAAAAAFTLASGSAMS